MYKYDFKSLIQLCALYFLIATIFIPTLLFAGESITWVKADFPPIWIMDGSDKGNGILDGLISTYETNLPEYEHHHINANITRILSMMRDGQEVCHAGILKSSGREEFIKFSIPNGITTSHKIAVKKGRTNSLFGNNKSVSLVDLLKNRSLKLGVSTSNSYGAIIDNILETYKDKNTILFRIGQDNHLGLLRMLKTERIDYIIGYPWEITYLANQIDMRDEIEVVDINELKGQKWIETYVGCTKNEWGLQVIEKIDAILLNVRASEEYTFHILKWLPENIKQETKNAYEKRVLGVTEQ
jgi:uncharacterized protein (TIGR02285 family)